MSAACIYSNFNCSAATEMNVNKVDQRIPMEGKAITCYALPMHLHTHIFSVLLTDVEMHLTMIKIEYSEVRDGFNATYIRNLYIN